MNYGNAMTSFHKGHGVCRKILNNYALSTSYNNT